jgi:hypothetical protein
MSVPLVTRHRANLLSGILFILGSALLYLSGYVIQGVPLLIGIIVVARQILRGRVYDICLSLVIFGGAFATYDLDNGWPVALPVFFGTAACYIVLREFLVEKTRIGVEEIEDLGQEVEEIQHEHDK